MKRMTAVVCGAAAIALAGCSVQEATNVGSTTATLNARLVNPTSNIAVAYAFQAAPVGTPLKLADPTTRVGDPTALPPNTDWTDVSQPVTGLQPDTEYHYTVCGLARRADFDFASVGQGCLPEKTFRTAASR